MSPYHQALAWALLAGASLCAAPAFAEDDDLARTVTGVVVTPGSAEAADRPLSARSLDAEAILQGVNATTVEDALKYLPNIFVRRRHIGDTQAPMTTRTSGVGASARSLIYADGVLLSALIGNNNSAASPRWSMVTPEEIARVDVLYGPFSAAYAGNSIGAVVEITTRTPETFEAQAKVSIGVQRFHQYATVDDYPTYAASSGMGDRRGALAWRFSASRLETRGQPLSYVTANRPAAPGGNGAVVTGAFEDRNRTGAPIVVLGAGGLERQTQDNAKLKLAWSMTPSLTADYLVGYFGNRTEAHVESYLRGATGQPVYAGSVSIAGHSYAIAPSAFAGGMYRLDERHWMQALSLRGAPRPTFDWEIIASAYDYGHDAQRAPSTPPPAALAGGPGTILDLSGTGWRTLDAKAVWTLAAHTLTAGVHGDRYELRSRRYNTSDWLSGDRGALAAASEGKTRTNAIFLEDAIGLTPTLRLTLGVRREAWRAYDGLNYSLTPALSVSQPGRSARRTSPKAVLAWTPHPEWRVSASVGQAYRFPTVSELYQSVAVGASLQTPDPDLKPERAISSELSVQRTLGRGSLRLSAFSEDVTDALVSQSGVLQVGGAAVAASFVQNVGHVRSRGLEAVAEAQDVADGLDLSASATFVDSQITRNAAFPAGVGRRAPQVPRWRATVVATWRATERLTLTGAARYASRPFGTIDNADVNGHTYQGFEGYLVVDARATWRIDDHWSAAIGVDNLGGRDYFVFHPFPQRSAQAELRYVY